MQLGAPEILVLLLGVFCTLYVAGCDRERHEGPFSLVGFVEVRVATCYRSELWRLRR